MSKHTRREFNRLVLGKANLNNDEKKDLEHVLDVSLNNPDNLPHVSKKFSRRKFLKYSSILTGSFVGFTFIRPSFAEYVAKAIVESLKVENPRPITLGTYGSFDMTQELEDELGIKVYRMGNFAKWHGGEDYIQRKIEALQAYANNEFMPKLSWSLINKGSGPFSFNRYEIDHYEYLERYAEMLAEIGKPVELCLGYEPNIDRHTHGKGGADISTELYDAAYKDMYERVVPIIRERAPNVIISWYVSTTHPHTFFDFHNYYPGNHLVDNIGLSSYDTYLENMSHLSSHLPGNLGPYTTVLPWILKINNMSEGKKRIKIHEFGTGRHDHENAAEWFLGFSKCVYGMGIDEIDIFNASSLNGYTGNMLKVGQAILNGEQLNIVNRNWRIHQHQERINAFKRVINDNSYLFENEIDKVTYNNLVYSLNGMNRDVA